MAVSKRVRFEVLRRDGFACRYCGAKAPDVVLTVDHVMPKALGGTDLPENLVAACEPCNGGKTSTSPTDDMVADVRDEVLELARWATVWADRRRAERETAAAYVAAFDAAWDSWTWDSRDPKPFPLPGDYEQSVRRFYEAGLPVDELVDAVGIAVASRARIDAVFRYMCGVSWRKVADMHEFTVASMASARPDASVS